MSAAALGSVSDIAIDDALDWTKLIVLIFLSEFCQDHHGYVQEGVAFNESALHYNDVMTLSLHHTIGFRSCPMPRTGTATRQSLNLRIKPEERGLIDRAAKSLGKTRTDFVLEAARRAAEDALLDRTNLQTNREAYAKFLARLDAPPQPNARLRRTLKTKALWE